MERLAMDCKQGGIYLVDFNPAKGGEIGKLRPAIIVSGDLDNELLATVVVVPLSTKIVARSYPYRVFVAKREKLQFDSDACVYEIRALSKKRVKEFLAKLDDNELAQVQKAICTLFGRME